MFVRDELKALRKFFNLQDLLKVSTVDSLQTQVDAYKLKSDAATLRRGAGCRGSLDRPRFPAGVFPSALAGLREQPYKDEGRCSAAGEL